MQPMNEENNFIILSEAYKCRFCCGNVMRIEIIQNLTRNWTNLMTLS